MFERSLGPAPGEVSRWMKAPCACMHACKCMCAHACTGPRQGQLVDESPMHKERSPHHEGRHQKSSLTSGSEQCSMGLRHQ